MSRIAEPEVLNLLTRLVEKSLVAYEDDEQGNGRYRLLETVRQYATDRLAESSEGETWRDRHLAHFLALGEEALPHLTGADQRAWLARLEAEHDNLRAALERMSASRESANLAIRLAGTLAQFWVVRGYLTEGRERLARALAIVAGQDAAARANTSK